MSKSSRFVVASCAVFRVTAVVLQGIRVFERSGGNAGEHTPPVWFHEAACYRQNETNDLQDGNHITLSLSVITTMLPASHTSEKSRHCGFGSTSANHRGLPCRRSRRHGGFEMESRCDTEHRLRVRREGGSEGGNMRGFKLGCTKFASGVHVCNTFFFKKKNLVDGFGLCRADKGLCCVLP